MIYDELVEELGDPSIGFVMEGTTALEAFQGWVRTETEEHDDTA